MDGRVAVVTGAGRGIGRAIALAYGECGARVVCAARTTSEVEETVETIRSRGGDGLALRCDAMKPDDRETLIAEAVDKMGRLDVLVNNVGGWPPQPTLDTSDQDFENAFRLNVTTAFALSRIAAPKMMESDGGGAIIGISSVAGVKHSAAFAAYGVAKAAMNFLTGQLAQDFAPHIRVNAIACGATQTEALKTVLTDDIKKRMVELTPLDRLGEVEDIAACAVYLASSASSYVTGQVIGVSGGLETLNMEMPRADLEPGG